MKLILLQSFMKQVSHETVLLLLLFLNTSGPVLLACQSKLNSFCKLKWFKGMIYFSM